MTKAELIQELEQQGPELRRVFSDWLKTRPQHIQDIAAEFPPDRYYKLPDDGPTCEFHRNHNGAIGAIQSYCDDGQVGFLVMHIPGHEDQDPCKHFIDPHILKPVDLVEIN